MQSHLESRLDVVREAHPFPPALLDRLGKWITTSAEENLYRINPLKWAAQHAVDETVAIDLFLYATQAGVFDMVWSALCTQCGMLITTPGGLKSMSRMKRQCRL